MNYFTSTALVKTYEIYIIYPELFLYMWICTAVILLTCIQKSIVDVVYVASII